MNTDCLEVLSRPHVGSGAIHVAYVSERSDAFGESLIGWDFASGCWYTISPPLVRGRAPDGRLYSGEPGKAFSFTPDDGDTPLEGQLFAPLRRELIAADGEGFSCEPRRDGGITISWQGPLGARGKTAEQLGFSAEDAVPVVTVTLVIDAQGRLVSRKLESPGQPTGLFEFTYPPNQEPGFEAPALRQGFKLVSYEFDSTGDLDRFDPVSVNSLAMTASLNIQRGLAADARIKMETQQLAQSSNPIGSYFSGQGSYLVPILGTGLVLVIVGIFAARRMKHR